MATIFKLIGLSCLILTMLGELTTTVSAQSNVAGFGVRVVVEPMRAAIVDNEGTVTRVITNTTEQVPIVAYRHRLYGEAVEVTPDIFEQFQAMDAGGQSETPDGEQSAGWWQKLINLVKSLFGSADM